MTYPHLTLLAILTSFTIAFPTRSTLTATPLLTEEIYPYVPPSESDARSPCPAMNTMANHGLLPHNGLSIDLEVLGNAALLGFNMTYETMLVIGIPALTTSTTGNSSTFHLSDLKQHIPRAVEHDASMSRQDSYFGNAESFNAGQWNRTLSVWENVETIDFQTAAQEIKVRFDYGAENNPEFNATFAKTPALLQYGLMLSTFGNTITGDGNKTLIRYWVENERFPFHMGWQPSSVALTLPGNLLLAGNISSIWASL